MAIVTVFNRFGDKLAQLDGEVEEVSWRLNNAGRATMAVSREGLNEKFVRYYNRVLIQFDNGLRDWGGVITTPRQWRLEHVRLRFESAEYILARRKTSESRYFEREAAAVIFRKLIDEANQLFDTGIVFGELWTGGAVRTPAPYHYANLLDKIRDLATLTGNDFGIAPEIIGGRLRFKASWYERAGSSLEDVALIEGVNCGVRKFDEVGPITNMWAGVGEGPNWTVRPKSEQADAASRSRYGPLEDARVFSGVVNQETVAGNTAQLLADSREAAVVLELEVYDENPAPFGAYWLGDRVPVELYNYGFRGSSIGYSDIVRVLGVEYYPPTGRCRVVTDDRA